jgi:uncharacterized protein
MRFEGMRFFQSRFHQHWKHLNDPDVRTLVWLLDSPGLLDPDAPQWQGKIAMLSPHAARDAADWLVELDRDPAALHEYLAVQPFTRLGRYAEKLLAFYFERQGVLAACGVQVRAAKNETIGEFDYLLNHAERLVHWEFATKLYLLESSGAGHEADYFVGPNLADTLGLKMRKILDRQLSLASHPAALPHLPAPVVAAQALVKGWLFYHDDDAEAGIPSGVMPGHCRGFWCALAELDTLSAERYVILPRLRWLAPVKTTAEQTLDRQALREALDAHFAQDSMPVLVALATLDGNMAYESDRGFIVPDDWRSRAGDRVRRMRPQ